LRILDTTVAGAASHALADQMRKTQSGFTDNATGAAAALKGL